jgi:uncharacterized protein (DUF2235 family)
MSKRIVFCADGTWQAPLNNTNVYRFFKGLTTSSDQVAFYDDGVGADGSGIERLIQGAVGDGLLQKIKDGYTKIAHSYEVGDKVFLVGFSRGAYTARSLAGMIAACGLPGGVFDDGLVETVFNAYRSPATRAALLAPIASQLTCGAIEFVGVWDTVGAMGIPAIFGGFDEKAFGFLDTSLHPDVKFAYQCVSVDEKRRQFPATLWNPAVAEGQTLEQVYFSGCHGDVGGGTVVGGSIDSSTRLCDITLGYIVTKAQGAGLMFDDAFIQQCGQLPPAFALDLLHESWTPEFGLPLPRPIAATATIANSVAVRIQYALTYLPPNLTIANGALAEGYQQFEIVDPAP